jgi:hypothetical protein
MSEDDYTRDASQPHVPGKHRGPRFTWNPAYEVTFFQSLCDSVRLGLREGMTFKAEAWDRAAQALIDRHNAYANKGHLINKSDNARKKYRMWRGLRESPEFLYNPQSKTITGSEEAWRRHIEVGDLKVKKGTTELTGSRKSRCRGRSRAARSSTRSFTRCCSPT